MSTSTANADPDVREDVVLYVIQGSHACRCAMLMLAHKRIGYRRVTLPTGAHPLLVRALGFAGHAEPIRSVDGATHRSLALLDRMGTVPALRYERERVQTNRAIARFLDRIRPEQPLLPADAEQRERVEAAELWGDQVLQMSARRLALTGSLHGLDAFRHRAGDGRLGALLANSDLLRSINSQIAARAIFRADAHAERELLDELPAMLDRIDAWIADGVLDGPALNVADFLIAPSLALIAYRLDLRAQVEARPAGALLQRVLPEPLPD
jgi:glutathione S-transferase